MIDDATLGLEPWSSTFLSYLDRLPRTILWMRLSNLAMLALIVSTAGRFVRMDESTSMMTKERFARVADEIDMARPIVLGTDVLLEGVDVPLF